MTDGTDGPASRGAEGRREGESKPDDSTAGSAHGGGAEGDGEPADVAEDHGAYAVATPEQLLSQARTVRRDARRARHAYWFPLVLFGLLTCASVPFYIRNVPFVDEFSRNRHLDFAFLRSEYLGGFGFITGAGIAYYWLAAILVGLAATAVWYRLRGNRVGLRTPSRGFIITGLVLVVLALLIPVLASLPGLGQLVILMPGDLLVRGTFPLVLIGIGLSALAWAERSIALTVIAAGYLAVSFVASLYDIENVFYDLGWNLNQTASRLPNVVLPALVLLLSGAGAWVVQRRRRPRPAEPPEAGLASTTAQPS